MNFNHPYYLNNKIIYAMNMVMGNDQSGVITNERTTKIIKDNVPEVKGCCNVQDSIILFTETNIQVFNTKDDTCEIILELECTIENDVTSKCRIDECGNIELYWTEIVTDDKSNDVQPKDKFLELDCEFKLIKEINSCDDLLFSQCFECPEVEINVVSGGNVLTGIHWVLVKDVESQNYCEISRPISIFKDCTDVEQNSGQSISINVDSTNYDLVIISQYNSQITAQIFEDQSNNFIFNGQVGSAISLNEVLVNTVSQDSNLLECFNNKLLKANLRSDKEIPVQHYAKDIITKWKTIKVNSNYYNSSQHLLSAMRDEVYSIGIRYKYCDGTCSSWAHIPNNTNTKNTSDINPNDDKNPYDCNKPKWEVYNTATVTEKPHEESVTTINNCEEEITIGTWERGELAYYESCQSYPEDTYECDIYDCEGNIVVNEGDRIFPTGNIRFHKMPDNEVTCYFESNKTKETAVPIFDRDIGTDIITNNSSPYDDGFIFPILLEFENIVLPPCTVGYEIGIVERNETNSTIQSKGFLHGTYLGLGKDGKEYLTPKLAVNSDNYLDQWIQQDPSQGTTDTTTNSPVNAYIYQTSQLNRSGNCVKFIKDFRALGVFYGGNDATDELIEGATDPNIGSRMGFNYTQVINVNCKQCLIKDITKAPHNSIVNSSNFTYPLNNQFKESSVYLELNKNNIIPLSCATDNDYTILTTNQDNNDENVGIQATLQNNQTSDESFSYSNHGLWQGNLDNQKYVEGCIHYVSLKNKICNPYSLYDIYTPIGNTSTVGLDSFISPLEYKRTAYYTSADKLDNQSTDNYQGQEININTFFDTTNERPTKTLHSIHFGFIESNINTWRDKCQNTYTCSSESIDASFNQDVILDNGLLNFHYDPNALITKNLEDNCKDYMTDYSSIGLLNGFITREYCCNDKFPNRIAYSNSQELTNREENWKVFLANNYIDIPKECGPITRLINMGNVLYAHTKEGVWRIFTNNQLQADSNNIYVGTGDLFNQVPTKIYTSEIGYGGLENYNDAIQTEWGYYWVDRKAGKIHHMSNNGQMKELNAELDQFFKENYRLCDATDIQWGYDVKLNRLLLTVFNEDKCFTISLHTRLEKEAWISFHSYKPNKYLSTRKDLYSIEDNNLQLHNRCKCEFLTPFTVEYVITAQSLNKKEISTPFNNILESIELFIETKKCNNDGELCICTKDYFDQVEIYNNCQSTGPINLVKQNRSSKRLLDKSEQEITLQGNAWVIKTKFNYSDGNVVREYPCDDAKAVIDRFNNDCKELCYPYYIVRLTSTKSDVEFKLLDRNQNISLKNK